MKKTIVMVSVLLIALLLGACSASPRVQPAESAEEVLALFSGYAPVDAEVNKTGIYLSIDFTEKKDEDSIGEIQVHFSSGKISRNLHYAWVMGERTRLLDANDLSKEVPSTVYVRYGAATINGEVVSVGDSHPVFTLGPDVDTRFIIVYFEGTDESVEFYSETPPVFFIIEVNGEDSAILTETPLLGEGLLP